MEATEEANIINSHPIKEGLVAFRRQFESSQVRLESASGERHCAATNYLANVYKRSGP
jgi:hypothetical protein